MRIGIDIRCLLESEPSGVAYYVKNLLQQLFLLDQKNQYFLFYNSYQRQNLSTIKNFSHFHNVKICGFRYPNKILNATINFIHYPRIDFLLGGVDIFFAPNLEFISLSQHCKKIVTVHDLSFDLYPEFLSLKRKLWHRFINPKKFICSADKIIAVSHNTKNDLINLYHLPENKISVVHSGLNIINNDSAVETCHGMSLQKLPKKYILTISTLEPRKNIESLIAAYKQLIKQERFKDYYLCIAGPQGWKAKNIYAFSRQEEKIRFFGFITDQDKAALYAQASVFVYPSYYEGFGFPPLEALNYGAPVIASMNSSLPEVLGDAALYVNPYDVKEIEFALADILTDEALRKNLFNAGQEQLKKFNWTSAAEKTLAVFNSLI